MRKTIAVLIGTVCAAAWLGVMIRPSYVHAGQEEAPAAQGPLPVPQDSSLYKYVADWAQLPAGTSWGVMSAVGIDSKGKVYGYVRAEPSSIMVFDSHGKYLKTFGDDSTVYAHGLSVAPDDSVWITDRKIQQAFKFSPDGKLLMTLGKKNVAGDMTSTDTFKGISDVATAANGDLFVSDGEGGNSRVLKLSKDGTFIKMWGTKGAGDGQFNTPHNLAIDRKGRVWVADRGNKRLQVFDQDGNYIEQFAQFGTPVSVAFDKNNTVYVADGAPENRVIIGTADGKVLDTIQGLYNPHGIAVSPKGDVIYVSESFGKNIVKFVKK